MLILRVPTTPVHHNSHLCASWDPTSPTLRISHPNWCLTREHKETTASHHHRGKPHENSTTNNHPTTSIDKQIFSRQAAQSPVLLGNHDYRISQILATVLKMSTAGPAAPSAAIQMNPHPSTVTPFAESSTRTTITGGDKSRSDASSGDDAAQKKKHSLFGLGNKKTVEEPLRTPPPTSNATPIPGPAPVTPRESPSRTTTGSPAPPRALSNSPGLSPRLGSPAGSQIFERDVQETAVALPTSPAIPSHIATEDLIPPVLDASSEAITDDRIDPDTVEIVTHTSHQPAALAVTGAAVNSAAQSLSSLHNTVEGSWADQLASFEHDRSGGGDGASNYGSLDASDVRRLSFISFADVVQAEHGHAATSRDSIHLPAGLTSLNTLTARSPSPVRSPVSSQGGGPAASSPPTSKSGSIRGMDASPSRKPLVGLNAAAALGPNSPPLSTATSHVEGDLKIETMSQALRRTGSADLSGVTSFPTSPVEGPSR
ncbi:hypothetical protein MGG_16195 [Pyricularia oryzae 70-15]|uniref:Uncharacterized protein n=1 Tax=Pyricularia oryzae (strain 70-15 / ATCC MYA-4617 / FGSC 8958) TaxID=242507 RepID=G4MMK3_PYRO7|nr:uncharacterized protein MGG_16195 [Pyricularia oryzae 70-15]EHA56981.1 hypothetical protein MGG_16195 [Pyricularia oryzae 70-15]KAI7920804.1 hypothetical protein M9X92_005691 [Pyricularia oryzae]KAI7931023.1 hypothetical protein M0657_001385 [Pyricularia oryzae]